MVLRQDLPRLAGGADLQELQVPVPVMERLTQEALNMQGER